MARKPIVIRLPDTLTSTVTASRRAAWNEKTEAMRSGVRQRATTIPSGKTYKRRTKHKDHR